MIGIGGSSRRVWSCVWIRVKWNKQFQFFDWGKIEINLGGVDL